MNQRIRQSGLSSKEICFKRDLIDNIERNLDDTKIVEDTMKKRLKRHHKYEKTDNNIQIGHNVFLKNDKTKLKARELYKVVELFEKNDEPWAVVQKHDSQFRLKKYNVKLDELFLLPGQLNHETLINDLENAKDKDFQPSNDKTILPPEPIRKKRPLRKAAIRARELNVGLNTVKINEQNKLSTHGWDYKRMLELFEYDNDEVIFLPDVENKNQINAEHLNPSNQSQQELQSDISTCSASPTLGSSTDSKSDTVSLTEPPLSPVTHSHSYPPVLPPRFPVNLHQPQDLSRQLSLPSVIEATQIEEILSDIRCFNRHHPTPPQAPPRQLRRQVGNPSDYARFHRLGQK